MKKLTLYILFLSPPLLLNAQWVQASLNPGIGYCLFSNDTTIYAGTNNGVYYSNDLGEPWFSVGPDDWIMSLVTAGNHIIAGSGSSKGIWITSNGGVTWTNASGTDNQSVYALDKNENYLFAGTWGGGVFRSENNGSSWQKIGLDGEPVEAVFSLGDTIFAGGSDINGAKVYVSTNNGNTWDYRYLSYPVSRVYSFAYKAGILFAGTDGGLYTSDDYGNNWTLKYGSEFDSSGTATDTKMFKRLLTYDQYLIAAITFNSIWISSDNGKNWNSFNEGLISDWSFNGLAVKGENLWALTESFGNAYRRPLADLMTGISSATESMPGEYVLYQNYPNPFNNQTTIQYKISSKTDVKIVIYNSVGQKIMTIVNNEKDVGTYTIHFNGNNLPSGVYYYQIITDKYRAVKKFLLLR